jgi:hypothetical protein
MGEKMMAAFHYVGAFDIGITNKSDNFNAQPAQI